MNVGGGTNRTVRVPNQSEWRKMDWSRQTRAAGIYSQDGCPACGGKQVMKVDSITPARYECWDCGWTKQAARKRIAQTVWADTGSSIGAGRPRVAGEPKGKPTVTIKMDKKAMLAAYLARQRQ